MQSGANFDAKRPDFIGNRAGAADAAGWTVKGGKNAVAGRFDLMTAKARQVASDCGVMIVEKIAPAAVAKRGGLLGRAKARPTCKGTGRLSVVPV